MEVEWHDTREDAYRAESMAIDRERPKHNIASRHQMRNVAETVIEPEPLPRVPYYNCGPQLPPMLGPPKPGNAYSLGDGFAPDVVPPNRRFDSTRHELVRKIMRAGDMLYIAPGADVPPDYVPGLMGDEIYLVPV
jgi:hypothetical protein